MRHVFLIVIVCLGINARGNFLYADLEFLSMENFSVEKKGDKVYVGFDYVINNPNWYGIVVKPSSLFLRIAEIDCGWVRLSSKVKLKRKSQASYPFLLVGDASSFVKSGAASAWALISGQGISFHLKGDLNAGVVGYKRKWPFDYTYKISLQDFLSLF